ncbi:hypothetical protein N867_14335 [Actinotalea fermentans ATCC 43279 = JCM 9966 = DSM 3133]|nr:hypothetical protein N867_14335 [Actinotalea fermentans ATCC 43279 = JCM 9966 = DSM 3133]
MTEPTRPQGLPAAPRTDRRPTTIGVLSPSAGGYFFGEVLSGIVSAVRGSGAGRVVLLQTVDAARSIHVAPVGDTTLPLAWSQVDALVSIAWAAGDEYLARARAAGLPVVMASNQMPGVDGAAVVVDNAAGVRATVDHLVEHGHTAIGFVGHVGQSDVAERYAAYQDTMRAHGLEPLPLVESVNQVASGGAGAAPAVAAAPVRWTAAVAGTDLVAMGLIGGLRDLGVRVPEDLAVVGFDDTEVGWYAAPPLTTVRQDFALVGSMAAELALAEAGGQDVPHERTAVPATFVRRESCGCPPSRAAVPAAGRPEAEALARDLWAVVGPADAPVPASTVDDDALAVLPFDDVDHARLDETISGAVRRLLASSPPPETIEGFAQTSAQLVAQAAARLPGTSGGRRTLEYTVARLTALLAREQAQHHRERVQGLAGALGGQLDVGLRLLGRPLGDDPANLHWLDIVGARTGCLGLWADDSRTTLRIAGVQDVDGHGLASLIGTTMPVEEFPPREVLDLAEATSDTVAFVVPVRGASGDHGVLCVVAPHDPEYGPARTTYDNCAALLGAALREQHLLEGLQKSEVRYSLAARAAADGLWEWDALTGSVYVSDRARELLDVEGPVERASTIPSVHPDDREQLREALATAVQAPDLPVEVEVRLVRRDGSTRWAVVRALGSCDESGRVRGLVGSLSDIEHRKSLEDKLRRAALFDHVTGLPNRRLFLDRLSHALEQRHRRASARFAVFFLDLDGFKVVNDSLGHLMGDELLQVVGERLRSDLRSVDTAARFGGDEFAVLLTDPVPEDLLVVARRIQQRISAPVRLGDQEVTVTASIGIATSATPYSDAEDVLRDADIAMYRAKESERGTACIFDPYMHERALARLQTRSALAQALERHEFVVHYQPVVDLAHPRVTEFEALVRWAHPERGLLPPSEFLPHLEGNHAVVALGHQVLDQVCAQVAVWRDRHGEDVTVAVNLSHREFWSADLTDTVRQALARHGLPGSALVLETTESVILPDPEAAGAVIAELRQAGVRVRLDDFGTGHSSVHLLRHFPVDALKIDGSFIAALGTDEQATALVSALLALGRAMGTQVQAEWVETPEQAALLRDLGCTTAQGWLFARPLPPEEADTLIGTELAPRLAASVPASDAPGPLTSRQLVADTKTKRSDQ